MADELKRRDFLVTTAALSGSLIAPAPGQSPADSQACPGDARCPYFDQPLFCNGERYCEK